MGYPPLMETSWALGPLGLANGDPEAQDQAQLGIRVVGLVDGLLVAGRKNHGCQPWKMASFHGQIMENHGK